MVRIYKRFTVGFDLGIEIRASLGFDLGIEVRASLGFRLLGFR